MLEKEFSYFESVRENLIKEHYNEYVVIKDTKILGFYKNLEEALRLTSKEHVLGTFLVQICLPTETSVHKYHSRAIFS